MAAAKPSPIVPAPAATELQGAKRLAIRLVRLWPIFSVAILGLVVFFASQHLIHFVDRTAAVFDGSFIQRLAVAAEYFFAAIFSAMLIIYAVFRTVGRYLEHDGLYADFVNLEPIQRVHIFLYIFTVLTAHFAACIWLVPLA